MYVKFKMQPQQGTDDCYAINLLLGMGDTMMRL
jgi:hypothetical protein